MRRAFASKTKRGIRAEHGAIAVESVEPALRSVPGKLDPPGRAIGND